MSTDNSQNTDGHEPDAHPKMTAKTYLKFAAMILTGMVVMYWVMFAGSWEWTHVRFSESRVFMALTMGGTMGLVMLAWMLNMYKNWKANIAVIAASLLLIGGGIEYLAGESFPLRVGYRRDQGRELNQITAAVGYVDQQFGLDLALRQDIANGNNDTQILLNLRYHVQ